MRIGAGNPGGHQIPGLFGRWGRGRERFYNEYELSIQTSPGGALQRVPGLDDGVAIVDFRYTVVGESGQTVTAREGCPTGSKAMAPDHTQSETWCWVKGRQVFDGSGFRRLDTDGVCDEDLSPALMRFCKATL